MRDLNQIHKVLEASYSGLPQPQDTDKSVPFPFHLVCYCVTDGRRTCVLIDPSTTFPERRLPRRTTILNNRCRRWTLLRSMRSWTLRRCSISFTSIRGRISSEYPFPAHLPHSNGSLITDNISFQISRCNGAQTPIMALPHQVPNMVPATLRASSHNRRVRTRRLRLL